MLLKLKGLLSSSLLSRNMSKPDGLEVSVFDQNLWHQERRFRSVWAERNDEMAKLLASSVPSIDSLAVFGCGPHQSFEKSFKLLHPESEITSFDLKAWNKSIVQFDLCSQLLNESGSFDCIVFSGVLEFVDILSVFNQFPSVSKYILFSYTPLNPPRSRSRLHNFLLRPFEGELENSMLGRLQGRISAGWKNHLTIEDIVDKLAPYGYGLSARRSKSMSSQIIFLACSWACR